MCLTPLISDYTAAVQICPDRGRSDGPRDEGGQRDGEPRHAEEQPHHHPQQAPPVSQPRETLHLLAPAGG